MHNILQRVISQSPACCSDCVSVIWPRTHTHTHTHTQAMYSQSDDPPVGTFSPLNETVRNLAENRSDDFTALFLITLFILVSMGVALYAISWAMWTMDPGRDSIIYRQVADPTM